MCKVSEKHFIFQTVADKYIDIKSENATGKKQILHTDGKRILNHLCRYFLHVKVVGF